MVEGQHSLVINNQMGFEFGIFLADASAYYGTTDQPYYGNVRCKGHEPSLWDCEMEHDASQTVPNCNSNDAVFLYCGRFS